MKVRLHILQCSKTGSSPKDAIHGHTEGDLGGKHAVMIPVIENILDDLSSNSGRVCLHFT